MDDDVHLLESELMERELVADNLRAHMQRVARAVRARLQRAAAKVAHYRVKAIDAQRTVTESEATIAALQVRSSSWVELGLSFFGFGNK